MLIEREEERPGVYIRTFGCQMNEYDSRKLLKILEAQYRPVETPERAALVLVNTCSVRDKPEQKLYSLLGELRDLKLRNPELMIGVGGCVAQQEGENIVRKSSAVDFVFGTHNLSLVPSLIAQRRSGAAPQIAIDYRDEWEELPLGFAENDPALNKVSTFISISRGCNKNCSYCIVPRTRGREVSRAVDEILREVRIAVQRGAREVILLGQTVNSYGLDLNPRISFVELLDRVAEVPGLERIRFTSPHPQEVRADFFEMLERNRKVCRHIHMPLQSGSDRILRAMNRNYRRKKYLAIAAELRSRMPDVAITTDLIVGFPGESSSDFEATLEVMKIVEFDNSYFFMFSPRPGTAAAALADDVTREEKLRRIQAVGELQTELCARRLGAWAGKQVEVLLEGASQADAQCLHGRTSQNFSFNLTRPRPELKAGMLISARVEGVARFSLKGDYITAD